MALGALIGAYNEDDSGGLAALLPLAGRTLLEYQVRCAAAAGASPIVVLVERLPAALSQALDRLRQEGLNVIAVSDGDEAAMRFEAGELILLIGDGVAAPVDLIAGLAEEQEPLVLTVPDDAEHERFERVDSASRWSGIALVEGRALGATAAMLGDWDLPSTLLRRSLQGGARLVRVAADQEPLLAAGAADVARFERSLVMASRTSRHDLVGRYLIAPIEDFATERLMETRIRPEWPVHLALALTLAAAFAFTRGWHWPALAALVVSTPLDLIGRRLGLLRLRPLSTKLASKRLLWPAAGLALVALGWWESRHGGGWGALVSAVAAAAFAQAFRLERKHSQVPRQPWFFSRRNAIVAALPFAAFGAWTGYLVAALVYAAASFFVAQFLAHRDTAELTTH